MKVLVCGGRNYNNFNHVQTTLDSIHKETPISLIISGAAKGADTLGEQWAKMRNVPVERFPADWNEYGKAAGAIRNQQMLAEGRPDLVVAFPGGNGTLDMIRRSKRSGVNVLEIKERPAARDEDERLL